MFGAILWTHGCWTFEQVAQLVEVCEGEIERSPLILRFDLKRVYNDFLEIQKDVYGSILGLFMATFFTWGSWKFFFEIGLLRFQLFFLNWKKE